jgi:hypothetical protein
MNDTTADSALVDDIVAELEEGIKAENEGGKAGWLERFSPQVRMRTINGMMIQVGPLFTFLRLQADLGPVPPTTQREEADRKLGLECGPTDRAIMNAGSKLLLLLWRHLLVPTILARCLRSAPD